MKHIFTYQNTKSIIHKQDGGIKLIILSLLSLSLILFPYIKVAIFTIFFILSYLASLNIIKIFKQLKSIFLFLFFLWIVRIIYFNLYPLDLSIKIEQIMPATFYIINVFLIFLLTSVFFATTSWQELKISLLKAEYKYLYFIPKKIYKTGSISLGLSLLLYFLPLFNLKWNEKKQALKVRNGTGIKNYIKILIATLQSIIFATYEKSLALQTRDK